MNKQTQKKDSPIVICDTDHPLPNLTRISLPSVNLFHSREAVKQIPLAVILAFHRVKLLSWFAPTGN